ncbi:hypothetical protein PR202_ga24629 [Eleusine coracana subsp. coracana]|uniref:F-box domain-containing protein n=1 Tax=Eleusine coracana subsp. coracana TaxID=191504 RepID=A0AAV5D8V2_ELECO|nr:hypothetical protein PR202_ga24629 [Eleusine coracana subsp. coracana]
MPLEDQGKKGVPPACSSGRSIDVMPDVILEHILGFLPAEDAVRTSVLAPRWRHLWKSATGLRIGCRDRGEAGTGPVKEYRKFLHRLFLLRGGWSLETCEIRARIGEFFSHLRGATAELLYLASYPVQGQGTQDDMMLLPPMLQNMPSLVEAFIRLVRSTTCKCYSCQLSDSSYNADSSDTNSVLLNGLSQDKSLTLISTYYSLIVFKGDLRWCPIFSNLKTLLLNEHWCVPDDFDELACILEHSPVLEKLTLQLFSEGPKHNVEMKGGFSLMGPSTIIISEHLDIVEIKCGVVDERVSVSARHGEIQAAE